VELLLNFLKSFVDIETENEKQNRFKLLDLKNEMEKDKAEREGKPYFGIRYQDDDRRYKESEYKNI